jgi:hypothetical protein
MSTVLNSIGQPIGSVYYDVIDGEGSPVDHRYPPGYVLRWAAPGVADLTPAYNGAALATLPYDLETHLLEIVPPAGYNPIDGTVYVRKGQMVSGTPTSTYVIGNVSGAGPTFKMGYGLIAGVETADSGGQPVGIDGIFALGSPAAGFIDFTGVAGGYANRIFSSGAALTLNINNSTDINSVDVIDDLGLVGISIGGSSANSQFTTHKYYNKNYDVIFSGTPSDIKFTDFHSEYNKFSSILFADEATCVNIIFDGGNWIYNAQYGTYTGAIHNRASGTVATFNNGTWRNMPGPAYAYGTGVGSVITFNNPTWDGARTRSVYDQSTLAAAVWTANETINVNGGTARNLPAQPFALLGTLESHLNINGLRCSGNTGGTYEVEITNTSSASTVYARNVKSDRPFAIFNSQGTVEVDYDNGGLVNTQNGNYTITPNDLGGTVRHASGSGHTYTIPAQSASKVAPGCYFDILNNSANNLSIAITTDTLILENSASTGTRTLSGSWGRARVTYMGSGVWTISGTGLT